MKCDGCQKREAALVLHMITNGQVATRSLCLDCAKKAHQEMAQAFSTMGMSMSGMDEMRGAAAEPKRENLRLPKMICASCRTAYEDINDETVFGCPKCYQAFHTQVIDYLSSIRGPEKQAINLEPQEKDFSFVMQGTETELKERLNEALRAENYEQAANLRDRLKELIDSNGNGVQSEDA